MQLLEKVDFEPKNVTTVPILALRSVTVAPFFFMMVAMQIQTLFAIHGQIQWRQLNPNQEVHGIAMDSRKVEPQSVYIAIRGHSNDGHLYVKAAIERGAIALVVEDLSHVPDDFSGAVALVLDSRLVLQELSQKFYGFPGETLLAIAVTGTNGKTSSAYIFEHLLNSVGSQCGVIGTINHHAGKKVWKTDLTTPDPLTLQERLRDFLNLQCQSFVIEASSHALDQNRIRQGFDLCLFTNLSRDHLDYHPSMEHYLESKAKLFKKNTIKESGDHWAVINGDDPAGQQLVAQVEQREILLFGQQPQNDFVFKVLKESLEGTEIQLCHKSQDWLLKSPLVGLHNAYNVVGVVVSLQALGFSMVELMRALPQFSGVPGRLQKIKGPQNQFAFIDYAHTPDALEKVLMALRNYRQQGRLITVFGCGGDRDRGKRPLMGEVATRLSDAVILTSDNPRNEDPVTIIQDIQKGIAPHSAVSIEVDRLCALQTAVAMMKPQDILLVAGKGHEDYQIIGGEVRFFDDYQTVRKLFAGEV